MRLRYGRIVMVALAIAAIGLAIAVGSTDTGLATTAGRDLVVTNAIVADATTATVALGSIVIRNGRIVALDETDPSLPIYDARGAWVVPGLIDAHAHMLRAGYCGGDEGIAWDNIAQIPFNFDVALLHGNTTVVDLGGPLKGTTALRDRLAAEATLAPRYLVAGPILTAPNGYPLDWADRDLVEDLEVVIELDDVESARKTVRYLAEVGVDVVKIASMEVSYNEKPLPVIAPEVFRAAVDTAHEVNLRVFVHAHSNAGYRAAMDAGADVIAHSTFERLPDEWIAELAESKVVVLPTLWVFASFGYARATPDILDELRPQLRPTIYAALADFHRRHLAAKEEVPPDFLPGLRFDRADMAMAQARDNLARMNAAGVTIGYGSDTSFCYALHGSPHRELEEMVRAGLTPRAAFRAATIGSAAALGRTDLGRLEIGAPADLLVLTESPFDDPAALAQPIAVVRDGRLIEARAAADPGILRTLAVTWTLAKALVGY